jgi:hypothetical protein
MNISRKQMFNESVIEIMHITKNYIIPDLKIIHFDKYIYFRKQ